MSILTSRRLKKHYRFFIYLGTVIFVVNFFLARSAIRRSLRRLSYSNPPKFSQTELKNLTILPGWAKYTKEKDTKQIQKRHDSVDEKIDWHDYAQIENDRRRNGPGEHGIALSNPFDPGKVIFNRMVKLHAFNGYASDMIALDRAVPDIRHSKCRVLKYRRTLPTVSIIIPFHEEHLKTLVRTFVTALKRAPDELVKEVILVDDASTLTTLKAELDNYVRRYSKVRVLRLKTRQGAIRARIEGIKAATADVVFILDSHCEANVNWLPPLLEPIAENYRTVTNPLIDAVENDDFKYVYQDSGHGARGGFNWNLEYRHLPRFAEDNGHLERPYENPIMCGGLYAISRRFYWEISGLDPKLEIWGAEHFDLSFKIWMCGGRMLDVPCSRFGHVFKKFMSFSGNNISHFAFRNNKRIVEVWMDEYKKHVYRRSLFDYSKVDVGDISEDLKFRKTCRSFKWFMTKVAPDVMRYYPPYIPDVIGKGEFRCQGGDGNYCIDFKGATGRLDKVFLRRCLSMGGRDGVQKLLYDWRGSIRPLHGPGICLELPPVHSTIFSPVVFSNCHNQAGNQLWRIKDGKEIIKEGLCLEMKEESKQLGVAVCNHGRWQTWSFEYLNITASNIF